MTVTLDCAIICRGGRERLVDDYILPSILRQGIFASIIVVGTHHEGDDYRYLHVPPILGTTMDGLIKRETASAASKADAILYLCDDHMLVDGWASEWPAYSDLGWDVLVPERVTERDGKLIPINNGMNPQDANAPYCAGHAGIFRRKVLRTKPWMAAPHDLYWDLGHSRQVLAAGFGVAHCPDLKVCDIDPNPVERERHFVLAGGVPLATE